MVIYVHFDHTLPVPALLESLPSPFPFPPDTAHTLLTPLNECVTEWIHEEWSKPKMNGWMQEKAKRKNEQECIPVGCVPPAAVAVRGGLHQAPPGTRHPQAQTPRDQAPPRTRPPGSRPPLWTEWQTGAKILPCPKLRLRAVMWTRKWKDKSMWW